MEYIDFNITQTGKILSSDKIVINKYDNKISRLIFTLDGTISGRLYFAMLNPVTNKYFMSPILDSEIIITTEITVYPGKWSALLVGVEDSYEIVDNNIDQNKVTFVSDQFNRIIVRDNFLSDDNIEQTTNPAIDAALELLRISQDRLEDASINATESALLSSSNADKTAQDREQIKEMVDSVTNIEQQVKLVEQYKNEAHSSALSASTSSESANESKKQVDSMKLSIESMADSVSENAQLVSENTTHVSEMKNDVDSNCMSVENLKVEIETLKTSTEEAAQKTAQDKQAVELAKTAVDKAEQAVRADRIVVEAVKESVEQLGNAIPEATQTGVQAVNQAKQTAVNEITKTGNTHKTAVEASGTKVVENVENVKETATKAIETAKTEAVKAVQTEGTTQTANVTAEGTKQLTAVYEATQEIVADREQIKANKADIAGIKEEMDNLSSAIINSATGETIVVEDSSENRFKGLSIYGKSTQVTTTGAQLFDVDAGGTGWISTETGEFNNSKANYSSDYIPVEKNTAYCFSDNLSSYIYSYDADKKFLRKETYGEKFTTGDDVAFIRFSISAEAEDALKRAKKIMLNIGSTPKPWEPYTGGKPSPSIEYPQEIKNVGDSGNVIVSIFGGNICNFPEGEHQHNGITYISKNGAVEVKGKTADLASQTDRGALMCVLQKKLKGNFYLSGATSNVTVNIKRTLMDGTVRYYGGGKFTLDGYEKEAKVYIRVDPNRAVNKTVYPIVNIGNVPLSWEPYNSQSLTITTPNGLRGLPVTSGGNYIDETEKQWICDEIDLGRGKYVQRIGIVNDKISNLNFNTSNNSNGTKLFVIADVIVKHKSKLMCNILRSGNTQTDDQVITSERGNGDRIYFTYYKANSIEELKTHIGENVINVLYELPEPIEHDLPPEVIEAYKKLHTNYPVTTVLNDAGAGMKVEYAADVKNYIDNKLKEIQKSIANTNAQLI